MDEPAIVQKAEIAVRLRGLPGLVRAVEPNLTLLSDCFDAARPPE